MAIATPKRMNMAELWKKANVLGISPGKMKKPELIRAIQTAEGSTACFGKSHGQCTKTNCYFMSDCMENTSNVPKQTDKQLEQQVVSVRESERFKMENNIMMETDVNVSQDRADILAIVAGLEGQVDTTLEHKQSLEKDYAGLQNRLAEELPVRARLEERVKSLEAQLVHADQLRDDLSHAKEEQNRITKLLEDSQPQLKAATKERDSIARELAAAQKKLSEASLARTELETQIKALKAGDIQTNQLREDLVNATQERNKLTNIVVEIRPRLEAATRERNSLAKELSATQAYIRELEGKKSTFEAEAISAKNKKAEIERLRVELTEANQSRQNLSDQVRDLEGHQKGSEATREALEKDLAEANEAIQSLRKEIESFHEKLMGAGSNEADLRVKFAEQTAELAKAKETVQKEIAERRQAEEMVREIKTRLLSLTQKEIIPGFRPQS